MKCEKRKISAGSSPHARGTPVHNPYRIPSQPVHPRMRGEHARTISRTCNRRRFIPACAGNTYLPRYLAAASAGSSPHARGTRPQYCHNFDTVGFIPACAGNTRLVRCCSGYYCGSSPHARGTQYGRSSHRTDDSVHPRMRGEHQVQRLGGTIQPRFIPACAGNTLAEYSLDGSHYGSSPHARGTPLGILDSLLISSVHPRMRGEH